MANRYFVGAIDADWNDIGNWSLLSGGLGGASVPVAGDDAIFDGGSPACNADVNVTPDNIRLVAGYAAQLSLVTFNATLAGGIAIAAGTMLFGSGTVTLTADLAVTGGTLSMNGASVFARDVTLSGGAINGNTSTLRFYRTWNSGGSTWTPGTGTVQAWGVVGSLAQQVTGNTAFNNFAVGSAIPAVICTLTLTGTVTVAGTFDYQSIVTNDRIINGGSIHAQGTVTNTGGERVYGTTVLYIDGNADQNVAINFALDLTVAKAGGACRFTKFTARGYNAPHTLTLDTSVDWVTNNVTMTLWTQGRNLTLVGTGGLTTLTVPGLVLTISNQGAAYALDLGGLVIACTGNATYTVTYAANNRRINNGRVDVGGNLIVDIVDNGAFTGSAVFRMDGAVNRTVNFSGRGQDRYWNPLEIEKTLGASVTLLDALGTRGAGQNLTVTSGVLDLAGFPITVGGTFAVAAGATLRARGDSVITATARTYAATSNVVLYAAGTVALLNNLGLAFGNVDLGPPGKTVLSTAGSTVTFAGVLSSTGTQANPVLIRSSVPGVQCFWTLTATASSALGNTVDVMDNNAGGGLTVMAIGSRNRGNNVNWWFGSGGGQHPRLNYVHAFPGGFTGGLSPRDCLSYVTGMAGQGGLGNGGVAPLPAMAAMLLCGASLGPAAASGSTGDRGATWVGGPTAALAFVDGARDSQYWYMYYPNGINPAELHRAPAAGGIWTALPIAGSNQLAGWTYTRLIQLGVDGRIFVLAGGAGPGVKLFRSANQGINWIEGANLVDGVGNFALSFVWQSYAGSLLVAHPTAFLRRSTNLGDDWNPPSSWPANTGAPVMLGQSVPGARIYGLAAGTGPLAGLNRVIYSDNDGDDWTGFTPAASGLMNPPHVYFLVTRQGSLLAVADDGLGTARVYRSTNGGQNWALVYTPPAGYVAMKLKQSLCQGNTLALALFHPNTPRAALSDDDGINWALTAGSLVAPDNLNVMGLAVDMEASR